MLGDLLKNIRIKKNRTKSSIANTIGVDTGYLTHIENGDRKPTVKVLKQICKCLDVPYQKFLACYDTKITKDAKEYDVYKYTAEDRILLVDDINDLHFMKCPPGLNSVSLGIRVNDDAMDTIFEKYSYVFVDLSATLKAHDIGLFYYNGQILIRRLFIYGKTHLSLYADNPKYPKLRVGKKDTFYIIGKIVQ